MHAAHVEERLRGSIQDLSNGIPLASPSTSPRSKTFAPKTPARRHPSSSHSQTSPLSTNPEQHQEPALSGPSTNQAGSSYAFPPGSSSAHRPSTLNPRAQRMSLPQPTSFSSNTRNRRQPSLLHEIQPPCRRLSSHQMLLLTPFGGVVPPGTLAPSNHNPGAAMARSGPVDMATGASSMSRPSGIGQRHTIHHPDPSTVRRDHAGNGGPEPRWHHSFGGVPGPSPLAWSSPMTAIPSASEHGSGSEGPGSAPPSREPSNTQTQNSEDDGDRAQWTGHAQIPETVPMTRSNSLPVMTLRELQALKQKDGELGIARGGGWAWVSQHDENELAEIPEDTNIGFSESSSFRPPLQPLTLFSDPFAGPSSSSFMSREGAASFFPHDHTGPSTYQPTSTIAGYRYSPTANEVRRMSEAPSSTHHPSPSTTIERRPSAPAHALSGISRISTSTTATSTGSAHGASSTAASSPELVARERERGSISSIESPSRPRLTRYRSLPGRNEGLGLSILVRQPGQPATAPGSTGQRSSTASAGTHHSTDTDRRTSDSSNGPRRRHGGSNGRGRSSGQWAAIDVVETLSSGDLDQFGSSATSPISATRLVHSFGSRPSSRRSSRAGLASRGSFNSTSMSPTTSSAEIYLVEEIASRAHLASVSRGELQGPYAHLQGHLHAQGGDGRPGITSDPASGGGGWDLTFPRRGSLAVLSGTSLGPWAGQTGVSVGVGETPHWSERRGSWAEGWKRN